MTLVIPNGYANITFRYSQPDQPQPASFSIGAGIGVGTDFTTLATDMGDAWVASLRAGVASTHSLIGVNVEDATQSVFVPRVAFGTGGSVTVDSWAAVVVKKHTNLKGRVHRGRMYLPSMATNTDSDEAGMWVGAAQTDFQGHVDDFFAALGGVDGVTEAALFHDSAGAGSALAPDQIFSLEVTNSIGIQRRRRLKG
jgi:hypothetical protein